MLLAGKEIISLRDLCVHVTREVLKDTMLHCFLTSLKIWAFT